MGYHARQGGDFFLLMYLVLQVNWPMSFQLHPSEGVLGQQIGTTSSDLLQGFYRLDLGCWEACIASTLITYAICLAQSWQVFSLSAEPALCLRLCIPGAEID